MSADTSVHKKFIVRLAAAQKEAEALKKAASAAKAELKRARKKFRQEKKLAKAAKKTVKALRDELKAAAVAKKRVARKRRAKPPGPKIEPVVAEPVAPPEPVETPVIPSVEKGPTTV